MLVTRLKNSRKFAAVLIVMILLACACAMVAAYPVFQEAIEQQSENVEDDYLLYDIPEALLNGNYFLYNEVTGKEDQEYVMEEYGGESFFLLRKYIDCEVFDYNGDALLDQNSTETLKRLVKEDSAYALWFSYTYSDNGSLKKTTVGGTLLDEAEAYQVEQYAFRMSDEIYLDELLGPLSNVKIIYGITQENLDKYIAQIVDLDWENVMLLWNNEIYQRFEWMFVILIAAVALLIPCNKRWRVEECALFRTPFEVVLLVWCIAVAYDVEYAQVVWNAINHGLAGVIERMGLYGMLNFGIEKLINLGMWFLIFAVVYWGTTCLRAIFTMKKAYWKERTLCAKIVIWMQKKNLGLGSKARCGAEGIAGFLKKIWKRIRMFFSRIYDSLIHLDFQDKTNKSILRIVVINFVVLMIVCCLWFYGIAALLIYSVGLFFFLRKYFHDIRKKYQLLLDFTNLLAEGNLDAPIEGDMGLFNPMKTELVKIQKGFKKAVEEEVKSERMKTELITNVSHDLKTPLTAIITYVDLLKSEKDPQKQKEYLEVLERKSLRLKVLIEDLFEISKATSRNVTMNFMQVDIVGLLKQVALEYDEKMKAADLEVRWKLPEQKVVLLLDSQKTYRIFENLIVNITKYAMPHTRVYVELADLESQVTISMKNISASELNFDTEEITDRFVRGDSSRNTEGSGLGLAIAKSFTELQYGTLKIFTDADLFKAEIIFPKRYTSEQESDNITV